MQQYLSILCVGVGGGLGAILRYLVTNWFVQMFGPSFPWGTFTINVSGAFCIGIVLQVAASNPTFSPYWRLFIATGILGGYTTFSTFTYETFTLGTTDRAVHALLYAGGSLVVGVAAATVGVFIVRALTPT